MDNMFNEFWKWAWRFFPLNGPSGGALAMLVLFICGFAVAASWGVQPAAHVALVLVLCWLVVETVFGALDHYS